MKNDFILASSSPRRKEILKNAGYKFDIIPSAYDENICNLNYSSTLVENCAYQKALDVFKKNNNELILSADTVVVLNNIILGKPKNKKEAYHMLKNLSGNTHFVATSVCLMNSKVIITDTDFTNVTFKKLNDNEIINYIETKNPLDKAGSYGIQDEGFDFTANIEGEIDNVIGFPVKLFSKMYKNFMGKK